VLHLRLPWFCQVLAIHFMPREQPLCIFRLGMNLHTLNLVASRSDLHQIAQIFFLRVTRVNPDFSVESEYFILSGDRPHIYFKVKIIEIRAECAILLQTTRTLFYRVLRIISEFCVYSDHLIS
jgi:hypothetical protein